MKRTWIALLLALLLGTVSVTVADEGSQAADVIESDAAAERAGAPELRSGEKFEFKAEVNRLMSIIIHSLYSNKDIFLRELISNASDALDKIRLLALSDAGVLGSGSAANLEIRMEVDTDKNILKIRDRGVGMSKDELIKNLGTIAKSGTSAFLEKMQQSGDANLIGQFGVGFYSVYLVSDYVEVISKPNGGPQHIWESNAGGGFVISDDTDGKVSGEGDLERGTMIRIHLKDENLEYAQEARLRALVQKYSEFINFPIYLLTSKEVEVPGGDDSSDEDSADKEDISDDDDAEADDTEKEKKYETVVDWELLNGNKAIWLRDPKEVEEEEYDKFYSALSKGETDPAAHAHFKAEGDVEFRSILFVPKKAPWDFYDTYYTRKPSVKLYVRRVFISDEFDDLLPRYLAWLLGLVDSDTLPLNVSRELLQQHGSLRTIKKKLVRKALDMLKRLAEASAKAKKRIEKEDGTGDAAAAADSEAEEEDDEEAPFDREALQGAIDKYEGVWNEFGRALKLGIMEDAGNRGRIAKLLRFHTTAFPDTLTSLDEYVARMKSGQKHIFFICGGSTEEVTQSPFLEQLRAQGYEAILFTEPMDEYMMQNLIDYDDIKFQNAAKEDLKLSDDDEDGKKLEKQLKKQFKPLTKWWRKQVGDDGNLEAVKVSSRLTGTPCVVVTSKYGWSANMQRIMQAQAMGDAQKQGFMQGKRIVEVNPRHPLIVGLLDKVTADENDAAAADTARLLYETALLESGYPMQDSKRFAGRVYELMREQLGVERPLSDLHPEAELDASADEEERVPLDAEIEDDGGADPSVIDFTAEGNIASDDHDEL